MTNVSSDWIMKELSDQSDLVYVIVYEERPLKAFPKYLTEKEYVPMVVFISTEHRHQYFFLPILVVGNCYLVILCCLA